MKKFLRTAVGVASALAVAVSAALVGIQFAAVDVHESPATTVEAPVLAPLPDGAADDAQSQVIGTDTVTRPGSARTTLPDDVLEALDTISASDDPSRAVSEYRETEAATAVGDPCSPADGEPPADCPDGLHSVILALDGVRDLYITGMAFPPTREEYQATSTYTMHPWCPATSHSTIQAPFGIFSTVPADFTVTYWPSDDPAARQTATARTSDADRTAYTAAQTRGVDIYDLPLQRSCLTLDNLEPDTAYTASLGAFDMFGRVSTAQSFFNSGGPLGVPGPQVTFFGDNVILARAMHTADERVVIHGILATDADPSPSCDADPTDAAVISSSETDVTPEYLLDAGVLPEYTHRANTNFLVPEGSTFVVCVRVYPAGDGRPSWETSTPAKESRVVVLAPDFVRPRVTLDSFDIPDGSRLELRAATLEGVPCGEEFDTGAGGAVPYVLCEPARVSQNLVLGDELVNFDYQGQITIFSKIAVPGDHTYDYANELNLGLQACRVTCPTPDEQDFAVWLGPGAAIARLHVTWEQGRTNGASRWVIPPIETVTPEYIAPELPDFDRNAATDNFQINWEAKNVSFTYDLGVDRPVDYTVALTSEVPWVEPACTDAAAPVLSVHGHADRSATLRFSGLCLGSEYFLDVTLRDAAGHTVRYSAGQGTVFTHIAALAPGWDGELVWALHTNGPDHARVTNFGLFVGGNAIDLGLPSDFCTADGVIDAHGTTPVTLGQTAIVSVGGYWSVPPSWSADNCSSGASTFPPRPTLWQPVTLDQIQWGAAAQGVWVHATDGYGTSVHLWMDDHR